MEKNYPAYDIAVNDGNLDSVWYSLDDGVNNVTITEIQDFIRQEQWEFLSEGQITTTFYANDTLGNLTSIEIDFIKEILMSGGNKLPVNLQILLVLNELI